MRIAGTTPLGPLRQGGSRAPGATEHAALRILRGRLERRALRRLRERFLLRGTSCKGPHPPSHLESRAARYGRVAGGSRADLGALAPPTAGPVARGPGHPIPRSAWGSPSPVAPVRGGAPAHQKVGAPRATGFRCPDGCRFYRSDDSEYRGATPVVILRLALERWTRECLASL